MINDPKTYTKIFRSYYKKSPPNNSKLIDYYNITYSKYSLLKLQELQKIKVRIFAKIITHIKEFIGSAKAVNFELSNFKNIDKYEKLILTTGKSSNILNDGSYFDTLFNENSKNHPNTLWFVINLDNNIPKKINKNILFFTNKNNKFLFIRNLIFLIIKKIFFYPLDKNKFFYLEILSSNIWKNINKHININKIKKIITPYEGQPFQNYVNYKLKKVNKKIQTIGYVHATQGLPIHLYKRDGAPELLYVHGSDQKYQLTKFFGWQKKSVKTIPSLKIRKKNKQKYQNYIFLPYYIEDKKFYLKNFEFFINAFEKRLPKDLKIKIHPHRIKDKNHIDFKNSLLLILKRFNLNRKIKFCGPIVIGPGSIILEALENKLDVYHIHKNIILDGYSNYYWPNIKVKTIKKKVISLYKIKKTNSCINIDAKKDISFLKI